MAWIAVDETGAEYLYNSEPTKDDECKIFKSDDKWIEVPKGTSLKLTGNQMTWEDEPVELKSE